MARSSRHDPFGELAREARSPDGVLELAVPKKAGRRARWIAID